MKKIVHVAIEPFGCQMLQTGLEWYLRWFDSSRPKLGPTGPYLTLMFLTKTAGGWVGGAPCEERDPDILFQFLPEQGTIQLQYNGGSQMQIPVQVEQRAFAALLCSLAKAS